jgi:hypothetical protein
MKENSHLPHNKFNVDKTGLLQEDAKEYLIIRCFVGA